MFWTGEVERSLSSGVCSAGICVHSAKYNRLAKSHAWTLQILYCLRTGPVHPIHVMHDWSPACHL